VENAALAMNKQNSRIKVREQNERRVKTAIAKGLFIKRRLSSYLEASPVKQSLLELEVVFDIYNSELRRKETKIKDTEMNQNLS